MQVQQKIGLLYEIQMSVPYGFTNSLEDFTVNYCTFLCGLRIDRHDMKGTPSNRVTLQQKKKRKYYMVEKLSNEGTLRRDTLEYYKCLNYNHTLPPISS